MKPADIGKLFEDYSDEFNKSDVDQSDLAAFNKLYGMGVLRFEVIGSAEHDEVWLNVDMDKFAEVATPEDIEELVRLGVCYDEGEDGLYMFV